MQTYNSAMEKQYIFYDTALGFWTAVLSFTLAMAAFIWILWWLRPGVIGQFLLGFIVFYLTAWMVDSIDKRRAVARKKALN